MTSATILLATVAASAAAASGGFGIGISPAVVTGPAHSTATFTISDAGSLPLHVRAQVVDERPVKGSATAWVPWTEYAQATVTPDGFNLQPGQSRQVVVVVAATDGYTHRLAVMALAKPLTVKTGAAVQPAIAAVYKVPGAPNPAYAPVAISHPQLPAAPFNWLPVGLGVAAAALLAALVTAGRKLRITRRG